MIKTNKKTQINRFIFSRDFGADILRNETNLIDKVKRHYDRSSIDAEDKLLKEL